jgi:DNA-binding CsgD family transcriptional regulator
MRILEGQGVPDCQLGREWRTGDWLTARSRLIERLCSYGDDVDFADLADHFREVVPHRYFAYAVVRTTDVRIERLYNLDFPPRYLRLMRLRENSECRIMRKWLAKREPLLIGFKISDYEELQESHEQEEPGAFLAHAQADLAGSRAIVFCLGEVPPLQFERLSWDLQMLTPYLYAAAVRSMRALTAPQSRYLTSETLTPREVEVLRWVFHGKTNDEIARILHISVYTVKNHVQRILVKLNATNRVQAVLRAHDAGLLRDDGSTDLDVEGSTVAL